MKKKAKAKIKNKNNETNSINEAVIVGFKSPSEKLTVFCSEGVETKKSKKMTNKFLEKKSRIEDKKKKRVLTNRVIIDGSGHIGIGSTIPNKRLFFSNVEV